MSKISKIAGAAILAGLLAGCTGVRGNTFQANAAPATVDTAFGVQDIAAGKAALNQGNMSMAIASFRLAAVNPQTAGEANNGLGIAFARLGYTELAEAHFAKAITLSPTDIRYSSNLARLYRTAGGERMLAQRQAEAEYRFAKARAVETQETQLAAAAGEIVPERRGPLTIATGQRRIARTEAKEMFLNTGTQGDTESATVPVPARQEKTPAPRVTYLRDLPTSGRNSRVTTITTRPAAPARDAAVAVTRAQTYPIRVRLSTRVED